MDKKELFDYIEKKKDMFLAMQRLKTKYENLASDYFVYLTDYLDFYISDNIEKLNELCNYEKYNKMLRDYLSNGAEERHVIIDLQNKTDKIAYDPCKFLFNQYNRMRDTQVPSHQKYKDFVCQDIELALDCGGFEIYTPYEKGEIVENKDKAWGKDNFEFLESEGDTRAKCKVNRVEYGLRDKTTKQTIIYPKIGFAEIKGKDLEL